MEGSPTGFWGKLETRDDAVVGRHPLAHEVRDG